MADQLAKKKDRKLDLMKTDWEADRAADHHATGKLASPTYYPKINRFHFFQISPYRIIFLRKNMFSQIVSDRLWGSPSAALEYLKSWTYRFLLFTKS